MYFHVLRTTTAWLPIRSSEHAVGYDLFAPTDGFLDPLTRKVVPLGFRSAFTNGYIGKIFDRSGLANKFGIASLAGVIDPDYRGDWGIILYNSTHQVFRWSAGDRLGQAVFWKVELPDVCEVFSLDETIRGSGAYGSTGK